MKQRLINIGAILLAVIGLVLWARYKNKPQVINGPVTIGNSGDNLIIHQPGKPDTIEYQPKPDTTVISTDSHGNVTVKVKHFGIGFDPGVGVALSDRLRIALDARLVYYDRLGLNVGFAFGTGYSRSLGDIVQPYAAIAYTLPFKKLSNTSLFVGATLGKEVIGGFRVRL